MNEHFGALLRDERLRRRLSVEEVHERCRIPVRFITGIEEDDISVFPAEVYYIGMLGTYARFLGMNEREIVSRYRASVTPVAPALPLPSHNGHRSTVILVSAAAALAGVIALAVSLRGTFHQPPVTAPRAPVIVSTTALVAVSTAPVPVIKPVKVPGIALDIATGEETWVKVIADEKNVFEASLYPGTRKSWSAKTGYRIVFGHIGGVRVRVNGEPVDLSGASSYEITELVVNKAGTRINHIPSVRSTPALPVAVVSVSTASAPSKLKR